MLERHLEFLTEGLMPKFSPVMGALMSALLIGCTTKIDSINPCQPLKSGNVHPVYGRACNYFTLLYGKSGLASLRQKAMAQVQTQANSYVKTLGKSKWELINTTVSKEAWPYLPWVLSLFLGTKCVKIKGYVRPKEN